MTGEKNRTHLAQKESWTAACSSLVEISSRTALTVNTHDPNRSDPVSLYQSVLRVAHIVFFQRGSSSSPSVGQALCTHTTHWACSHCLLVFKSTEPLEVYMQRPSWALFEPKTRAVTVKIAFQNNGNANFRYLFDGAFFFHPSVLVGLTFTWWGCCGLCL